MDQRSVAGKVGSHVVLLPPDLIRAPCGVFAWLALVPANGGVVIVGPGINSAVGWVAFRAERFGFRVITEGKLKDSHSGEIEFIPKCIYFRCDDSKVLC
jgi:hypothetical protein